MYKKTISYVDFDDNDVEKTFYFNLNKLEAAKLMESTNPIVQGAVNGQQIENDNVNVVEAIAAIRELLELSVGQRVGDRFIKNDEVRSEFFDTPAYEEFVMDLAQQPDTMKEFVVGILPRDVRKELDKNVKNVDDIDPQELQKAIEQIRSNKQ